ncbi:hypothetical protein T439DRAFT_298514 [Meredithblackwellia eburnea MCA 4105]
MNNITSSSRRLLSTTAKNAAKQARTASASAPAAGTSIDIKPAPEQPFDFPLTRDTILKLETRRTYLHYLRLEHFQFKELQSVRTQFRKPSPSQVIKVRHQHYQGEQHPADRKVTVQFKVQDLPLSSDSVRHKFKLLAGPRWNAITDEVKISCELYPTDLMNEKWCSDTIDRLIEAAEDQTDPMSDIQLDTRPTLARLRKTRKKHLTLRDFPQEWLQSKPAAGATQVPQSKEKTEASVAGAGGRQGAATVEQESAPPS